MVNPDGHAYQGTVRGVITKAANASATVVVSIGGTAVSRTWPYGTAADESFTIDVKLDAMGTRQMTITVVAMLERQTQDEAALLSVDSFDGDIVDVPALTGGGSGVGVASPPFQLP